MLAFFRKAMSSWITLAFLALMAIAMVVTGVGTPSSMGGLTGGGSALASVGNQSIQPSDVNVRLQQALKQQRQQNPLMDMAGLVRGGAVETAIRELLNVMSVTLFGEKNGMVVSRRLIDGEIAGNPAFYGANGKFDDIKYRDLLAQNSIPESLFRSDIANGIAARHLLVPVSASPVVPQGYSLAYASMKLERRTGLVVAIPTSAFANVGAPTDVQLAAFYKQNSASYLVPETRVVRYAVFDRSRFEGKVLPTDADIATFYKANAARFGAKSKRGFTQIIVQDQASATKVAAAANGGSSMESAAKASGFEALKIEPLEQTPFAGQSSTAVAKSAFEAKQGAVIGPVKSGLGWHVIRVDTINNDPGKTLPQARAEIFKELSIVKEDEALQDFSDKIDEAVADGETFDAVTKSNALAVETTPAVDGNGTEPGKPTPSVNPELAPVLKEAFGAEVEDDPMIVPIGKDRFVFFKLDKINVSAPKPLASIKDQVLADYRTTQASKSARKTAETLSTKINSGTPFATALGSAGVPLPRPEAISSRRIDILRAREQVPPPVNLMFNMPHHKAKIIEMPEKKGWYLVWLDKIEPGDAKADAPLIAETGAELRDLFGGEMAEQFGRAAQARVKVKRNEGAIDTFKKGLTGQAAQ